MSYTDRNCDEGGGVYFSDKENSAVLHKLRGLFIQAQIQIKKKDQGCTSIKLIK